MAEKKKKLIWDKTAYKFTCGCEMIGGQRKPKVIRLGDDARIARMKIMYYRMAWSGQKEEAKAKGVEAVWTDRFWQQAEKFIALSMDKLDDAVHMQNWLKEFDDGTDADKPISTTSKPSKSNADASAADPATFTCQKAMDAYGVKLDADVMSGERSRANAIRLMTSLKQFARFVADQPYDPDADKHLPKRLEDQAECFKQKFSQPSEVVNRDMNGIGYDQLSAFVVNIKNRRVSGYEPITIHDAASHVSAWLSWLEEAGKWKATCNYTKLLKVKTAKLFTPQESRKKAKGQDTFTVDELATIYGHANERQRLYLLLGLNICGTQQQIADLMDEDIHLDADPAFIEFVRGKTRHSANNGQGIEVRYDLWPMTAQLLASQMKQTKKNDAGLVLLTENGLPLVRFAGPKGKSRVDTVKMSWENLMDTINKDQQQVRPLGYKYLRKTTATMVLHLTDEHTQQQALAHSSQTIAGKHYTGASDFTKMNAAMKTIWQTLEPKFLAAAKAVEEADHAAWQARRQAYLERQRTSKAARRQAKRQEAELVAV